MPILQNDDDNKFTSMSGFRFSGTNINTLANRASEYTLVGIAADRSGSVCMFAKEIEGCLKEALSGCQKSPRVDNLLVRLVTFNHNQSEEHGFRPLADCPIGTYDGVIKPGGGTALYDTTIDVVDSMATYGKELIKQDCMANGIAVIITDGMDESSVNSISGVKAAFARAMASECLESVVTILIGVNVIEPAVSRALQRFKDEAGFTQYVEVKDASQKTFAKIAGFISKSVSSQSQSIGQGAASQPITF